MLCKKPFERGGVLSPCGQCMHCRFNLRRMWTHRLILESMKHETNSFLTLTYDNEHCPADGGLRPEHTRDWLKRFRSAIAPAKVRYYLVGEYGDETWRPHYHAALFGVGRESEEIMQSTWGKGNVFLGDLTLHSAQYIVGYVVKKMNKPDDPRLDGLPPEFARMSLKPGIGASAMADVGRELTSKHGADLIAELGDVPNSLMREGKNLPLGRYLRSKLREESGFKPNKQPFGKETFSAPQEATFKYAQEMQTMFADALTNPKYKKKSLSQVLVAKNDQKRLSFEKRQKLYKKEKKL
jgi:hypothetical protein